MATRGHLGGLALATPEAVRVLDAAGTPWVLVETVGVGQVEVEVAAATDTTVVVLNPGWGDAVQANKAGLMEIADVFVVNKADRPGAADTERDVLQMLGAGPGRDWRPPVVRAVATTGDGVDAVWAAVLAHRAHLEVGDRLAARRRARLHAELRTIARARLTARLDDRFSGPAGRAVLARLDARELDPYSATALLLGEADA
jgi:LAO/AO transport system kinase